jgi:Rod binding domain-containing protein
MPDLSITRAGSLSGSDPRQKLHQVAKAFEQQFAAQLLKPMTEPGLDDGGLFGDDPGGAMFKGMMVDGLAEHAAGGMGIAAIIEHEFSRRLNQHGQAEAKPRPDQPTGVPTPR